MRQMKPSLEEPTHFHKKVVESETRFLTQKGHIFPKSKDGYATTTPTGLTKALREVTPFE